MRAGLEQLERIDAYIANTMSAADRAQFEEELLHTPGLKELTETQQLMVQTIRRQALLAEIARYGAPASGGWAVLKWLSVGIVVAGLISAGIYWKFAKNDKIFHAEDAMAEKVADPVVQVRQSEEFPVAVCDSTSFSENADDLPGFSPQVVPAHQQDVEREHVRLDGRSSSAGKTEDHNVIGLKTWIAPERQYFEIDPQAGATIECMNGTLIIVPENAFTDEAGKVIRQAVQLEIVEALSLEDMLAYNLTTTSDGKHLQSGGMICIQPFSRGSKVKIDPHRPIYIEIPAEKIIPGMMAWKGTADAAGNINWTSPVPLEKFLVPVKFDLLDFLPPGFEQEIEASLPFRGHTVMTKKLADSLYYSLATTPGSSFTVPVERFGNEEIFRVKKNTYALNGRVIEKDAGEPVNKAKILVYSFEERNEIDMAMQSWSLSEKARRNLHDAYNQLRPIDSTLTDEEGSFTLHNMSNQNIYFRILHPEYEDYKSPDLILPLNRILTFQPVIELKRIVPRTSKQIALMQVSRSAFKDSVNSCMIDPLSIKTIRSKEFARTFIATREFEARLRELHGIAEPQSLLEIYISHLDGNLWEADSLVALELIGDYRKRFEAFAAEKLTNVRNDRIYQDKLTDFYNRKRAAHREALGKMRGEYRDKTAEHLDALYEEAMARERDFQVSDIAEQKIEVPPYMDFRDIQTNPAVNSSYGVTWYETGWMNIDCYNSLLTKGTSRVKIKLNREEGRVLQSINTMKIVLPLTCADGEATAMFPEENAEGSSEMNNAFCIGIWKEPDAKMLAYAEKRYDPYQQDKLELEWKEVTEKELMKRLRSLPGADMKIMKLVKEQIAQIDYVRALEARKEKQRARDLRIREAAAREKALLERLKKIAGGCGIPEYL